MPSNRQRKRAEIEDKNARDIYSSRFGIDGCSRSSLEVLKTDRTFWISLLTLAKTEMAKTENMMSCIAFPYSNTLLAICYKNARNIDI